MQYYTLNQYLSNKRRVKDSFVWCFYGLARTTRPHSYQMICFTEILVESGKIVCCHNVKGLLVLMGLPNCDPSDWQLFIDNSKRSLN